MPKVQRKGRCQVSSGSTRPSEKHTKYKKETRPRYHLTWELDAVAFANAELEDGIFPLLTNDKQLTAEEVLRAYKRQPIIEKRFPIKDGLRRRPRVLERRGADSGPVGNLLLRVARADVAEGELRQAMARKGIESLPLYPEGRPCSRPTTARVIEVFEPIERHLLVVGDNGPNVWSRNSPLSNVKSSSFWDSHPLNTAIDPPTCPTQKSQRYWFDDLRNVGISRSQLLGFRQILIAKQQLQRSQERFPDRP